MGEQSEHNQKDEIKHLNLMMETKEDQLSKCKIALTQEKHQKQRCDLDRKQQQQDLTETHRKQIENIEKNYEHKIKQLEQKLDDINSQNHKMRKLKEELEYEQKRLKDENNSKL